MCVYFVLDRWVFWNSALEPSNLPKYQVDVSIWILKHIYSKLQYNVCKYHWYPTEKTIRWSSSLHFREQKSGNWGPSPAVDRVIHWQYLGWDWKLGDIIVGPGILEFLVSGFWNLRSFLVGGFSWVESTISVWKLYSLELLALAVHLHLPLASSARKHILQLHSLLFIVFSLLSFCCISVCWNIVHPLHVDHIYVYL